LSARLGQARDGLAATGFWLLGDGIPLTIALSCLCHLEKAGHDGRELSAYAIISNGQGIGDQESDHNQRCVCLPARPDAYNFAMSKASTEMLRRMKLRGLPAPNIPTHPKLERTMTMDPRCQKDLNNAPFISNLARCSKGPEKHRLSRRQREPTRTSCATLGITVDTEGFDGCEQAKLLSLITGESGPTPDAGAR